MPPPPSQPPLSEVVSSTRGPSDPKVPGSIPVQGSIPQSILDASTLSRPGSTTSMGSRHESELMDQLRKVEESAAKDKWRNIVHFCKEVSFFSYLLCLSKQKAQALGVQGGT